MTTEPSTSPEAVAIVGMAGRFPRARNLTEFWRNLREGVEAVSFFRDEDVQWLPIEHPPVVSDPRFVKSRAVLEKPEWFDAGFFGMNPREASIMDPQHRVLLECAWEALEDAGCDPERYPGLIGVFAGASMNTYLFSNLLTNPDLVKDNGLFSSMIANDGDFVPTRISYKLNLRGPSINVQTACSTSLVAVCLAAQSLLSYRCDVALAGGVSITFPPHRGQHHLEGGIHSADGHCRAFDAKASGTVLGDGAGIVVLKRLSEALADGDRIHAVIKGNAVNNDGSVKIGYTAPSVDGQAECIAMAQAEAGVDPKSISYVEAHGTGTPLGDPIEIAGLVKAFGIPPGETKSCAVGSVKSNIGHLDIAAGVAGLIKTVLAIEHGEIPPSLHFETPNPKLELDRTPFVINRELRPWPRGNEPRRAGVSSFGIGGTNAHVVLEEAPEPQRSEPTRRPHHLLALSAKTPAALEAAAAQLAAHLVSNPGQELADVAHSLQTRRKAFAHRRIVVASTHEAAIAALSQMRGGPADPVAGARNPAPEGSASPFARSPVVSGVAGDTVPAVTFMFPGQGAQSLNMGAQLYATEPRFRATFERCCELLKPLIGLDLRTLVFGAVRSDRGEDAALPLPAAELLAQTRYTQPALFAIEYALADLWMHYGVRPSAMIGHSLGEYVAACVSGVFSLEDAVAIVAERARIMQAQPGGAMVAVRLPEERVLPFLDQSLSLAATNARGLCVVSGPFDAITALEKKLGESGVASRRLATSHAFHSSMMDAVAQPLADFIARFERRAPGIPFVSNVTGTWITAEQARDPMYWAAHVRKTVRFAEGVARLLEPGSRRVLLEAGPGETLAGLARQEPAAASAVAVLASLGRPKDGVSECAVLLRTVGQLWIAGVPIDWNQLYAGEGRRFVSLPAYPFQRERYWIEPGTGMFAASTRGPVPEKAADEAPRDQGDDAGDPREDALRKETPRPAGETPTATQQSSTLAVLRKLFGDQSGMDLSSADAEATFYQLGFDSLFLTQASVAVSKRFGVEVTFRELRDQYSSLAKLAAHLEPARRETPASSTGSSRYTDRLDAKLGRAPQRPDTLVPLTDAQRELWFASQLGNEVSSAYNESANIRLKGRIDVDALKRAFHHLVARHEALRTTILRSGEQQRIAATSDLELSIRDFTRTDPHSRERRVREFIDGEVERPFDLLGGPLVRAHLLRLEEEKHIVLFVVHHIICDGWSLGILQKDLSMLYSAEVGASAPPPATAKFSDYAVAQLVAGDTDALKAAEEFWLGQFADGVPPLDLPTDRPRPAERTYAGAFVLRKLPADLTAELKAMGARHDCTTFTLLLAAFNVMLYRLSGQNDLVVGIPAAAQVMDGAGDLVGHFANLLPVRNRVGEHQPFNELLTEVKRHLFDALEHWRYPFGRLLKRLNIPRDGSRMPLANVVFNSTRLRGTLKFGDVIGEVEGNPKRFSHFDLNFNFAVAGDSISMGAYYSSELFDAATIERWFGHFETLLRSIIANPACPVDTLALLTEKEREQILVHWNEVRVPYDATATLASLFEAQVARTPDAIALVAGEERLTYRTLDARAGRLAQRLREAGVGADTLVGVFLERTSHLLVAILGILKAGGAYVPLDPSYPVERIDFVVHDTGMPIVVTREALVPQLPAGGFDFMVVDDERPTASRLGRRLVSPNPARATPESLAYVIYTSGSTGQPKGVTVVQRAVVAHIAWARRVFLPEELDGMLFSTSASFDVSVFEMFVPLCSGGKVILAENVLELATLPAAGEVRLISTVPSAMAEVLRLRAVPAGVTTIAMAGEPFSQQLLEALHALPHIRRVFDHYGPTETTVYSTGGLRVPGTRPSFGRPLANEQIFILDRNRQPVPIGVAGEIYIGGDKLARGYLKRPELTAERFVPHPFAGAGKSEAASRSDPTSADGSAARTGRLYRTGDMARWCADGTIESLGRVDHQVKVRGFRVELGEVEAALSSHPDVAEAVVLSRPHPLIGNRLLGYIVPQPGTAPAARELRRHLKRMLPEYMVPSTITVLEKWPVTATGKIDRKALPDPENPSSDIGYVAPGTTTEELLATIWREVIGITRVGVHDNFFELGGHSLLATQVIARIHDVLEVEVSMRQFFAAPTIAGLAVIIEGALIREIRGIADTAAAQRPSDALVRAQE